MIQTNLDTAIWTQDDTSKILDERSRVATFDPAEVLHKAHGKIIYFGDPKLLCLILVLSISRCQFTLTAYANTWPASEWSVSLDIEQSVDV